MSKTLEELKSLPKEEQDALYKKLKATRKRWKPVNYGGVYGIGAPKLAREMGISVKEAAKMIKAYWDRNWAVKKVANDRFVKELKNGELWMQNPVSRFYHSLRYEKDRFSTLNQGTGVYCFDTWTKYVRQEGVEFCGQFHDEHIAPVQKGKEEETVKIYTEALEKQTKSLC